MSRILVIDNYDSFTYNLVHYLEAVSHQNIDVCRNDGLSLDDIEQYEAVVLSPGPALPKDAGIMPGFLQRYAHSKKILGVCLGHQAIAEAFGGRLQHSGRVMHGLAMNTRRLFNDDPLLKGLPEYFLTGRYHSWEVDAEQFPDELEITATDDAGRVMALRHRTKKIYGMQFHPESLLSQFGKKMIENWLNW